MRSFIIAASLAAALVLQACSSVVVPTVLALNATDPLTADPAGFEIAMDMPEGADIAPEGAALKFFIDRGLTDEAYNETFVLQRRQTADGRDLFRIDPADLDAVRTLQATALAWETEDPAASSGGLGMSVTACSIGDGPAPDATFSVAIRTQVDGPFLPLIRNAAITDALEAVEALEDAEQSEQATQCE